MAKHRIEIDASGIFYQYVEACSICGNAKRKSVLRQPPVERTD